ncbi:MAG: hypothetical protein K2N22_06550 [Clostridia bacterium]|nr:hypothetical protein [Clostridia bacterium]
MTAKQFFKSNVFKCIAALLCVLLVCGVFLTLMNALMYVSPEEETDRAINKIYGQSVKKEKLAVANYFGNADIEEAYHILDDGNYLIRSKGKNGYEGGTVTCWIVVLVKSGKISGIGKIAITGNEKQSYIDRVSDKALNQFGQIYTEGIYYSPDLITNATVTGTKTAICNAVNGAIYFVNAQPGITGGTVNIYENFLYTGNIETNLTKHEVLYDEEKNVTGVKYTVVTSGYAHATSMTLEILVGTDKKITSITHVKGGGTNDDYINKALKNIPMFVGKGVDELLNFYNGGFEYPGEGKSDLLQTGASESTYTLFNAALFAAGNYDNCIALEEGGEENE